LVKIANIGVASNHIRGVIGRTIIHNEDLTMGIGLSQSALDCLAEKMCLVAA
jgi:hypothetical protein